MNLGPVAQRLIELSGDLFFVITGEGYVLALSKEWENLLGWSVSELRGAPFANFIIDEDKSVTESAFQAVLNGSELKAFRNRFRHKNGPVVLMEWRAVMDEESHLVFAAGTPIRESKLQAEELEIERQKSIQASKLASLGEMAAGIAHEVNNPLSIISGYLKILEIEWNQGSIKPEDFQRIMQALNSSTERAAKIITNLKNLARDGATDPMERAYLREILEGSLDLMRERMKRHGVALDVQHADELWIDCRPVEISQVILNLLINAYDAIEGQTNSWIRVSCTREHTPHVLIKISNSGPLINKETREKIFNPFFTTKLPGKGTGLGLSIAGTIIRHHNGEIYLDDKSPHTTFVIRLPLAHVGKKE